MNMIRCIALFLISSIASVYALGEPLIIGIENSAPPFIIQGGGNEVYGFDIDMMNSLCKTMVRSCRFRMMKFNELLPSVANKTVDLAVGAITITIERSKVINFSLPYLMSHSRFLEKYNNESEPFSLNLLANKRIGVETGTIFSDQIKNMNIKNAIIKEYPRLEELLEGLSAGKVDYILLDNPSAIYWEANSSGAFHTAGEPYTYGAGFGIAINKSNLELKQIIDKSLLEYQNSNDFKINYDRYLYHF